MEDRTWTKRKWKDIQTQTERKTNIEIRTNQAKKKDGHSQKEGRTWTEKKNDGLSHKEGVIKKDGPGQYKP